MSKIKKFLSVALVFITCLISLASVVKNTYASNIENNVSSSYSYSNAVVEDNGVSYTLYYNSIGRTEAAIAYNSGGENTVINVPDKFTSVNATGSTSTTTITAIYESGFANCTATQINLPNTIKQIGKQAFLSCTNLVTFVIPSKVTVIDVATFMNCTALTDVSYMNNDGDSVKVNNTITAINENAFTGCRRLSSFTMPNTLTYIGRSAFKGCVYLTRVILPSASNELEVDDYAFANCNLMIMAYVPNNIKRFGEYVFNGNEKLTIYLSRSTNPSTNDGYTSTWNKTYVSTGNNSYIPYKLNYGRVDLTPTNNFIYSISTKPIMDNFEVHTLDANKDNSEYAVLVSYLGSMDSSEDEVNNGVLTIPEYVVDLEGNKYPVKVIEEGCFSATATNKTGTNLKKVSLPEQLVKIGRKAFFDTTNLADIDFSRCTQLKEISTDAFKANTKGNSALTSLNFPASLEIIDGWAFENLNAVKSITFNADSEGKYHLKAIGNSAFINCGKQNKGTFDLVLPPSLDDDFYNDNIKGNNKQNAYGFYCGKAIERNAFAYCEAIKSITLNESDSNVKSISIGYCAFFNCEYIKTISLDTTKLYEIDHDAFTGNWSTKSVYLNTTYLENNSYTSAWGSTIFGKNAYASIYLSGYYPKSGTTIAEPPYNSWDLETSGSDFSENGFTSTALRRATVPVYTHVGDTVNGKTGMERVQTYSNQFDYLEYSDHITITNAEEKLRDVVITIPGTINDLPVTEIGPSAFGGYRYINYIKYDSDVKLKKIGDYAFWSRWTDAYEYTYTNSRSIASIYSDDADKNNRVCKIPSTVTYVGEYAFMNNHFKSVSIPSTINYIGLNAFGSNAKNGNNNDSLLSDLFSFTVEETSSYFTTDGDNLYSKNYDMLFFHARGAANKDVVLNTNTKIIGFEAFNGSDITSVTFNSSLQKINGFAFNRNTKLTEVKGNLTGLQYINYKDGSVPTVNGFGQSPFNGEFNEAMYSNGAFESCSSLTSINLKSATSLVAIGTQAFYKCSNITNYTGGNQIEVYTYDGTTLVLSKTIGNEAQNSLLDLRCDNGGSSSTTKLTYIGKNAFYNNTNIQYVFLPNSLTYVGEQAFKTDRLGTIYCEWKYGTSKSFSSTAFNYNGSSVHTQVYYVGQVSDVSATNNNINYWTYYINDDKTIDRNKIVTFGTNGDAAKAYIGKLF